MSQSVARHKKLAFSGGSGLSHMHLKVSAMLLEERCIEQVVAIAIHASLLWPLCRVAIRLAASFATLMAVVKQ